MIDEKKIKEIQEILEYKFKNIDNLKSSLIHPSVYKSKNKLKHKYTYEFERLEFLGDRVLGLSVASLIFNKFIDYNEGDLSIKFSFLVQKDFLFKIAQEIKLENFIVYNTQKQSKIRLNKSVLADSIESLIGAIYLDGGFKKSLNFISRIWSPHLKKLIKEEIDPKTILQEITQKKYKILPIYNLIKTEGPSHSPRFTISLNALSYKNIRAQGSSIREAEKNAARKILDLINEK